MSIIKGIEVAKKMMAEMEPRIAALKDRGIEPQATIIRVGAKEEDLAYERMAIKKMETLGMKVSCLQLEETISQEDFEVAVAEVNDNPLVHGILLFRPLPKHLDETPVLECINPLKDADGICPANLYKVMVGDKTGFAPCTAEAALAMIDHMGIDLTGKRVVVVGRSLVVGKPFVFLALNRNATVTVCHTRTKDLAAECQNADVIVVAVGRSGLLTGEHLKEGAVVVDVGINVDEEGNMTGDVDFASAEPKCEFITPVPGGVGSVTTTMLAEHVIRGAELLTR
ncbi:bifunctional 5,10-methylenetetrahydrofolate dehydrogenase/5,10-methenyltetrahydrofolate cyclohydrolase [Chakrabartyella piscis]|uniref:bifunctional 5,10-methylenetetrahydrofolate dehydrogenase/5,10-methenyltetrahydrofolate cyclohydrolase n=1 Tax=Chakrabartyella piscis TaxID=2918914 RepID=UPI0029584F6B|nr:bifunctional 5,10-methylenetetrahydrofolate dehydrogenase/5,10-methenyltetrahydrofolate cyclohydrolase [Chakrabartyella piscis]